MYFCGVQKLKSIQCIIKENLNFGVERCDLRLNRSELCLAGAGGVEVVARHRRVFLRLPHRRGLVQLGEREVVRAFSFGQLRLEVSNLRALLGLRSGTSLGGVTTI